MRSLKPALLGSLVASLAIPLHATSVYTDPVGAVVVDVPAGTSVVSNPFQHSKSYQGVVESINGAEVALAGSLPELNGPHYAQVITGVDEGSIFDIASASGSAIQLEIGPSGLAVGDVVAIRKHFTLSDLGAVPNGTTVTLLNGPVAPTVASYIFGSWGAHASTPIHPGEGFIVNLGTSHQMVLTGAVSVDDVVYPLAGGSFVVGNLDPVEGSANVLTALTTSLPAGSTITEITADGTPQVYQLIFGSWSPNPSAIDTDGLRTFIVNSGSPLDLVLPGFDFND